MIPSPYVKPNFNRIARAYRWLEYLTLGVALEHCRQHFLSRLRNSRRALVLGDGDGRFLARLLTDNSSLTADAVDTSSIMLKLLTERCECQAQNTAERLRTHCVDALEFLMRSNSSTSRRYDLVVTHFFLDCFSKAEVRVLVEAIIPTLSSDAIWLVSEFRIPSGILHVPASIFVRFLYLAFRIITGLRTFRLPDYEPIFTAAGLSNVARKRSFAGILTTEIWSLSCRKT